MLDKVPPFKIFALQDCCGGKELVGWNSRSRPNHKEICRKIGSYYPKWAPLLAANRPFPPTFGHGFFVCSYAYDMVKRTPNSRKTKISQSKAWIAREKGYRSLVGANRLNTFAKWVERNELGTCLIAEDVANPNYAEGSTQRSQLRSMIWIPNNKKLWEYIQKNELYPVKKKTNHSITSAWSC